MPYLYKMICTDTVPTYYYHNFNMEQLKDIWKKDDNDNDDD